MFEKSSDGVSVLSPSGWNSRAFVWETNHRIEMPASYSPWLEQLHRIILCKTIWRAPGPANGKILQQKTGFSPVVELPFESPMSRRGGCRELNGSGIVPLERRWPSSGVRTSLKRFSPLWADLAFQEPAASSLTFDWSSVGAEVLVARRRALLARPRGADKRQERCCGEEGRSCHCEGKLTVFRRDRELFEIHFLTCADCVYILSEMSRNNSRSRHRYVIIYRRDVRVCINKCNLTG